MNNNSQNPPTQQEYLNNVAESQPNTGNPQSVGGDVQPVSNIQDNEGQLILGNENARIIIPDGNQNHIISNTSNIPKPGINWLLVVVVSAVFVIIAESFFRKREQKPTK